MCIGGSGYWQISVLTTKMSQASPWRSARLEITALTSGAGAYSEQRHSSTNSDSDDDDETFEDS